jgi:hypothetical protein
VSEKKLTPASAKAVADKVIAEGKAVPKKIPAFDDIDAQTKAVGGAIASAALTATDTPLHMLQPVVGALAAQLVAYGIRQQSVKLPDPPKHADGEPVVARTDVAPKPPKKIAHHARAVKR